MSEYLQKLDLHYLVLRLVNKLKWDLDEAEEAVRKYKNFLTLHYLYPKARIVPTTTIDEVWHNHILYTKNYTNDCEAIFGYYLHHYPTSGSSEEQEFLHSHYLETTQLYEEHFHESYEHALNISLWLT